jgi:hypothetical protein
MYRPWRSLLGDVEEPVLTKAASFTTIAAREDRQPMDGRP